jgi:hypothetical protein
MSNLAASGATLGERHIDTTSCFIEINPVGWGNGFNLPFVLLSQFLRTWLGLARIGERFFYN